jgi:hypothetical protein
MRVRMRSGRCGADRQLVADQFATAVGEAGGRLTKHTRYHWLLLAESHLTRRLFAGMLRKIPALLVAGWIEDCWVADKMAPGANMAGSSM